MNFKMRIFKAKTQLILESYHYHECLLFKVARVVGVHHSLQIWFMGATDGCVNPFVLFFASLFSTRVILYSNEG